jgi:hypothetical protein
MAPWKPSFEGEIPTLGWQVIDWMRENLAAPDRATYEPFILTREQAQFVLQFYAVHPVTLKRRVRRGVLSRPRGWGKSPFLGALACVEALGPVVLDGFDADGQPVGIPWALIRTPLVQVAAVSEKQTQNTWTPLLEMLRDGPAVDNYPGLEPLDTFVILPKGKIDPITSSPSSVKGNKAVFAVLDQTEEWTKSNGGHRLASTMRINAAKIGGSTVESPNAFIPGMDSVAEQSAAYYKAILEGRTRDEDGLLYDHREAPPETSLVDRESLLAGLAYVYGDSAESAGGWVDLDRIVQEVHDPAIDPQIARADFLNQITHATDAWLDQVQVSAVVAHERIEDGEVITLGFDGSKGSAEGGKKPDATGLVACRVRDGHLFVLGHWEAPDGPTGDGWEPPMVEIEAAVADAFRRFKVAGFFCDPAKGWRSHVNAWEGQYSDQLVKGTDSRTVKASRSHPFEWWMSGGRQVEIVRATKRLHDSIANREITIDGSHALVRHLLNARRRASRVGIQIAKQAPEAPQKIDLAVCAVLALEARDNAVALGITGELEAAMGGWTF